MKITKDTKITKAAGMVLAVVLCAASAAAATAPESARMTRAKDFIADEQWSRAIAELQAAADDPKEPSRDEALFWLAHSQHQSGDDVSALQTIARLERQSPASRWVHPARSLRIEIAQRLRRDDVLWLVAAPRPPAPPAAVRPAAPPATPRPMLPTPAAAPAPPAPPAAAPPAAPSAPTPMTPMPPPAVSDVWLPFGGSDTTLKVQALSGLIDAHSEQAIPLLRAIALDRNSPDEARQAVFVLGQSRRPEAERTVIEVAREAAEPVRIAAVRELGRFDAPTVSTELMRVYSLGGTPRLKRQVVASLGDRADNAALLRIAQSEHDTTVRDYAILALGRNHARDQLRTLYAQVPSASRVAVLTALFSARDDEELIRIATSERDPQVRLRARQQLRMLATPKAIKFLEENPQ
jgi:hypothetical protein